MQITGQAVYVETKIEKFNDSCHRRPLVSTNEDRRQQAYSFSHRSDLSQVEKAAFFLHELTGCDGLEFVAFSNARLKKAVTLTNDVVLVPCFLQETVGLHFEDSLVQATHTMERRNRFVYDGWIPIHQWNIQTVRKAVRYVSEALSLFALYGRTYFDWEPKYPAAEELPSSCNFEDAHLTDLEAIAKLLSPLQEKDRVAIYRSMAWLAQGIRLNEPEARFLCSILAIESLASYIEKQADDTSPLAKLRTDTLSKDQKRAKCEQCIQITLAEWLDKDAEKAIAKAYSDCGVSITKLLKGHLLNVFAPDNDPTEIFFKRVEGKHLYDLRSHIGHGTADPLDELAREQISRRVWDAEQMARRYIRLVLEKALSGPVLRQQITASTPLSLHNAVLSSEGMYQGPTHMAYIYS